MKEQRGKKIDYVFMVTDKQDPFELPLFVADTMQEIADFLKTKRDHCYTALCRGQAIYGRYIIRRILFNKGE